MDFKRFYIRHEGRLGSLFEKYGVLVANHPWRVIWCCIVVNCLLGLGLIRIDVETNSEVLYTPITSQAKVDREVVTRLFPDMSDTNFYYKSITKLTLYTNIIIKTKDGSNILTNTYLDEIERIYNIINNSVQITYEGMTLGLKDVCAIRMNGCVIDGMFVVSPSFRTALANNNITYPFFENNDVSSSFGGTRNSDGLLNFADNVRLYFPLRTHTPLAIQVSEQWEDQFVDVMGAFSSSLVDIIYLASQSLEDELEEGITGDVVFFALTIVLMLVYAVLAMAGGNCVSDRQNLGPVGVLATTLALLSSLGLASAIGVKFVAIAGILPFLIIGIGLDDMFILMSCLADAPVGESIENRVKVAMKTGGVAITITSISDCLAFVIGASAPFVSVRNFCICAGLGVTFCYLNHLTLLVPFMVLNERRTSRNEHCATCRRIKPREELRREGRHGCYVFCCGGEPPKNRYVNESPLETYPKILLQKIVAFRPAQVLIVVLFLGYLAATVYGIIHLERGLNIRDLIHNDDSYVYTYLSYRDNTNNDVYLASFTVTSTQTYYDLTIQNQIHDLMANALAEPTINPDIGISYNWLADYQNSAVYNTANEVSFIAGLKLFLSVRNDYVNDVMFNDAGTGIIASRFYVLTNEISLGFQKVNMMTRLRQVASNSPQPVTCFSPSFVIFDEIAETFSTTLTSICIAVAVMFVVTIVFMPHPLLVVCVTCTMVMICSGIIGFMVYWDLALSPITMIQIIMSIGFSVDFSAHICHAYITVKGSTRRDRVHNAMDRAGGPIINGALSSIVGLIVLLFSKSYIFKSFFIMMFMVMVLGLAHALLLLPIIFLYVGPIVDNSRVVPVVVRVREAGASSSQNELR